jgi:hypothetical protein
VLENEIQLRINESQPQSTVLTYEEYRAVSGVFQKIDPHLPLPQRVCPPPAPKAGGTHSPGGEGVGCQYFIILEDAKHRIGLLQYNLSTVSTCRRLCPAINLDGGANVHSTITVLLEGLYFAGSRLLRFHIFYF